MKHFYQSTHWRINGLYISFSIIMFLNEIAIGQTQKPFLTGIELNNDVIYQVTDLTWIDKNENENYVARYESGFVQVGDRFFVFGGRDSAQTMDVYNYAQNTWSSGGLAQVELNHFQAVSYEGLIWVIGAFKTNNDPNEVPTDYIYMYNPASEEWIQGMEIPQSRKRGGGGLLIYNDKFYIVGGNTLGHNGGYVSYFDGFDPTIGVWTQLTNAPRARDHFHAALYGDKLYVIGGRLTGGAGGLFGPLTPEIDIYDFITNSWSTLDASKNLPTPRAGAGTVVFQNEIYIIGGETTFQYGTVEAFNPITNSWSTKSSLNFARHGIQAIVSGNGIHIAGGSEGGVTMKNMEVYGTDNPIGSPNINSSFSADETTKSFTYSTSQGSVTLEIILSNTLGTTGTYIKSVAISGTNYTLSEPYNNLFLGANKSLTLEAVLNDTTQNESNGNITITYNNNSTLNITLAGELDVTLSSDFNTDKLNDNLKIYPNPIKSTFSLNKNVTLINIYDINGKHIVRFNGNFSKGELFNISHLAHGLYFIRLKNALGDTHFSKLVKF
jgi:Secretion system C-terminal sorting domain/Kelch motif